MTETLSFEPKDRWSNVPLRGEQTAPTVPAASAHSACLHVPAAASGVETKKKEKAFFLGFFGAKYIFFLQPFLYLQNDAIGIVAGTFFDP